MEAGTSGLFGRLGAAAGDLLGGLGGRAGGAVRDGWVVVLWEVLGRPVRTYLIAKARGEDLGEALQELSEGGAQTMWLVLQGAVDSEDQWVELEPEGNKRKTLPDWALKESDSRMHHALRDVRRRGLVTEVRRIESCVFRVRVSDSVWDGNVLSMLERVAGMLEKYGHQTDLHVGSLGGRDLAPRRVG